jgi:hypothetical protein
MSSGFQPAWEVYREGEGGVQPPVKDFASASVSNHESVSPVKYRLIAVWLSLTVVPARPHCSPIASDAVKARSFIGGILYPAGSVFLNFCLTH